MKRTISLAALGVLATGVGLFVATDPAPPALDVTLTGNAERGEAVFWAAGCASCHKAEGAPEASLALAGGQAFPSDFGTFYAPNVSMDPETGIGSWTEAQFERAVRAGLSPDGAHYYPVFPYTAYGRADTQDIVDLWAFWQELPSDPTPSRAHDVGFPFNIRASLAVWKRLYMSADPVGPAPSPEAARGRYLVEALAHCGECHTPRTALGGLDTDRWLTGAPNPTGEGNIPPLTPDKLRWSADEITAYLADGFTPDFDSAGGHMVSVIANLAKLPEADRIAITAYLKALPGGDAD